VNEQEHIYFGLGLVCEVSHDVTKNISWPWMDVRVWKERECQSLWFWKECSLASVEGGKGLLLVTLAGFLCLLKRGIGFEHWRHSVSWFFNGETSATWTRARDFGIILLARLRQPGDGVMCRGWLSWPCRTQLAVAPDLHGWLPTTLIVFQYCVVTTLSGVTGWFLSGPLDKSSALVNLSHGTIVLPIKVTDRRCDHVKQTSRVGTKTWYSIGP
jgi:hypothetical protein